MRAAVIDGGGLLEALRIARVEDPKPGDSEVMIQVEAISIEGGDLASRREGLTVSPKVLGYAAAGTIV